LIVSKATEFESKKRVVLPFPLSVPEIRKFYPKQRIKGTKKKNPKQKKP